MQVQQDETKMTVTQKSFRALLNHFNGGEIAHITKGKNKKGEDKYESSNFSRKSIGAKFNDPKGTYAKCFVYPFLNAFGEPLDVCKYFATHLLPYGSKTTTFTEDFNSLFLWNLMSTPGMFLSKDDFMAIDNRRYSLGKNVFVFDRMMRSYVLSKDDVEGRKTIAVGFASDYDSLIQGLIAEHLPTMVGNIRRMVPNGQLNQTPDQAVVNLYNSVQGASDGYSGALNVFQHGGAPVALAKMFKMDELVGQEWMDMKDNSSASQEVAISIYEIPLILQETGLAYEVFCNAPNQSGPAGKSNPVRTEIDVPYGPVDFTTGKQSTHKVTKYGNFLASLPSDEAYKLAYLFGCSVRSLKTDDSDLSIDSKGKSKSDRELYQALVKRIGDWAIFKFSPQAAYGIAPEPTVTHLEELCSSASFLDLTKSNNGEDMKKEQFAGATIAKMSDSKTKICGANAMKVFMDLQSSFFMKVAGLRANLKAGMGSNVAEFANPSNAKLFTEWQKKNFIGPFMASLSPDEVRTFFSYIIGYTSNKANEAYPKAQAFMQHVTEKCTVEANAGKAPAGVTGAVPSGLASASGRYVPSGLASAAAGGIGEI